MSDEVVDSVTRFIQFRMDSGRPMAKQELPPLINKVAGATLSQKTYQRVLPRLKRGGLRFRKARMTRSNAAGADIARIEDSFTNYKIGYDELERLSGGKVDPSRIILLDETCFEANHSSLGGGDPVIVSTASVRGRVNIQGFGSGTFSSSTVCPAVAADGTFLAMLLLVPRANFYENDFLRRSDYCGVDSEHPLYRHRDREDVFVMCDEKAVFRSTTYTTFIGLLLEIARRKVCQYSSEPLLLVQDNAPAHSLNNDELVAMFRRHNTICVTLAGTTTAQLQVHDVGLFGAFKANVQRAINAMVSVLNSEDFEIDSDYNVTHISRARREAQEQMIVADDDAGLARDLKERLNDHDARLSIREQLTITLDVWFALFGPTGNRSTRVKDTAELVGYFPISRENWMRRGDSYKKDFRVALKEHRSQAHDVAGLYCCIVSGEEDEEAERTGSGGPRRCTRQQSSQPDSASDKMACRRTPKNSRNVPSSTTPWLP